MNRPLISPQALADRLAHGLPQDLAAHESANNTVVVDCRFNLADTQAGLQAWQQGHIPGAVYAHLDRDLSGVKTGSNGRHPLPAADAFLRTLSKWGIHSQTHVVAYDDAGGMFAARLWWMLTHWSGAATCSVLDGGWQQWVQDIGTTETQSDHTPPSATATVAAWAGQAGDQALSALVTTNQVLDGIQNPGAMQLLDARAPDRFMGQNETLDPIGGHIPGALNRFFKNNLDSQGRFKPTEQLRDEFTAQLGLVPPAQIVHQCGSGVTACHNLLAMDVAGLTGSRLYAGSWSEWCADASRPMAMG